MSSQYRLLLLILVIYLFLAVGYGALNPLFEAPDEHYHYFTAQTIAVTNKLPFVSSKPDPWMAQEAAQPPLYYIIASAIIKPLDTQDSKKLVWPNPRVQLGDAGSPTNINAFVHTQAEQWPWQGFVLAGHLLRLMSALIGLGTLLCVYGSGRLVWPEAPNQALLATAMVAFLPQYAFLHGSITNDTLIVFLCAAALWQLLRMWYTGINWIYSALLGLTIGLAILSKMAGLLLLIYALGFLALLLWRHSRGSGTVTVHRNWLKLALVPMIALLIGGWVLWRNWQLYGDITATSQFVGIAGGDRDYSLLEVLGESSGLWTSIFGIFGWFNVRVPGWIYLIWNGIVLAALLGSMIGLGRSLKSRKARNVAEESNPEGGNWLSSIMTWPGLLAMLLAAWVFIVYAGLIRFMLMTPAAQGRLLFPALVPLALGMAYGLSRYRWQGVYFLFPALALLTSLYSLFFVIPGAYARPLSIAEAEIPETAGRLQVDLGQGLELIAAEVNANKAIPDEWVQLILYWQATQVPEGANDLESPEYVLEVLGQDDELAGKMQSYHGGGLYPASLWASGQLVADQAAVRLDETMAVPALVRLNLKIVGEEKSVDVGTVKVSPVDWPELSDTALAQIEGIELVDVELSPAVPVPGKSLTLDILWQVVEAPGRDLTTFVHLGDPAQPPLAQGDSPPLNGDYPTRVWDVGEVISDSYAITVPEDIPSGRYPLQIGLYDPESGIRLPLIVEGIQQPNDAYVVSWITIGE